MATNSSDVTAGTNATSTQYNDLRKDHVLGVNNLGTETDAATVTVDWSDKTKGKIRTVTLGASRTLAFSNVTVGQAIYLRVIQNGTGGWTLTQPAGVKWGGVTAPVVTPTANRMDTFVYVCTAAATYDGYVIDQNMA